ncbi:MAG: PAS domain S-box protein [Elusimicrobia bacterium]|nr:PAS domain S-box protein [Elusimicrobiota bacterium]
MTLDELEQETQLAAMIADDRGLITFVNAPWVRLFGWSEKEALGAPLSMIIPPKLREAHFAGFNRFLKTGESRLMDRPLLLKAVRKDGVEFMAEHFILTELRGGKRFFGATIRDVVPRVPAG